mmetsp:Transcript_54276/g.128541  ORF Transcript_54276/g.128541 Transcript_54276/m.128541 type:complete len:210 (-) Transcript_54276:328-957(-)
MSIPPDEYSPHPTPGSTGNTRRALAPVPSFRRVCSDPSSPHPEAPVVSSRVAGFLVEAFRSSARPPRGSKESKDSEDGGEGRDSQRVSLENRGRSPQNGGTRALPSAPQQNGGHVRPARLVTRPPFVEMPEDEAPPLAGHNGSAHRQAPAPFITRGVVARSNSSDVRGNSIPNGAIVSATVGYSPLRADRFGGASDQFVELHAGFSHLA